MPYANQPTFVYRGRGIELCLYMDSLTVTEYIQPTPRIHTVGLDQIREVQIERGMQLVLTLDDGALLRFSLGSAASRARDAIVRAM